MQKEIRRRVQIYGVAAVLLALVLGMLCYNFGFQPTEFQNSTQPPPMQPSAHFLKTFSSLEELRNFLKENAETQGVFPFYGPLDIKVFGGQSSTTLGPLPEFTARPSEFSTTNVQVVGVDEADIVKTDGEHIYLIANNTILILKAYPPNQAQVLSKITFTNAYPAGIFISSDGKRLAVLGSKYTIPQVRYSYYIDVKTFIRVYDISDKTNPVLKRDFTMSGSYFNSRMIGEYVYAVISQPAYIIYDTVILPKIYYKNVIREIEAPQIHYSNVSDDYYTFTTVTSLNILNDAEEPNTLTIMMGGTSNLYVSLKNIYITFHESSQQTSIYRIRIENQTMRWEAKGNVSGRELNQFSMDEYNNYFRIATTTWANGNTQNNLYILDMNLSMVGSLTNIAPDEAIDSARFIGNRCYLATSVARKDPFFVIDVENPEAPKILGYLKIPGFTRYLHPYDETHVIGVGRNENNSVKISIFDVSNVNSPIEIDKYTVPGAWSDTLVLEDHKAFLFDKAKELLAMPVSIYDPYKGSVWQGAYVFKITTSYRLIWRGSISHQEPSITGWDSSYWVKRTLYIENVLYTVSERKIKMNSLEDLSLINEIVFP
ncbi:MAG: beta-propeller domain-containing protein [Candidatus Bathyarchaeia archaeon]